MYGEWREGMVECEDMSDEWCEEIGECKELRCEEPVEFMYEERYGGPGDCMREEPCKGSDECMCDEWFRESKFGMSDVRVCVCSRRVCVVNSIKD